MKKTSNLLALYLLCLAGLLASSASARAEIEVDVPDPMALTASPVVLASAAQEPNGLVVSIGLDDDPAGDVQAPNPSANQPDFAKGTWSFQTYGSTRLGDKDSEIQAAHIGFGYYFKDDLSFNVEVQGGYADMPNDQAGIFALDLLLRGHLYKTESFSVYMDGGVGMLQASRSFPENGTNFNFTAQVGFGMSFDIADHVRLMLGARYVHLSNASIHGSERNPSFDGALLYAGVMVPF